MIQINVKKSMYFQYEYKSGTRPGPYNYGIILIDTKFKSRHNCSGLSCTGHLWEICMLTLPIYFQ